MKVYIVLYNWVDTISPTIQKVFRNEKQACNYIEATGDTRRLYVEEHEVEEPVTQDDCIDNTTIILPRSGKTAEITSPPPPPGINTHQTPDVTGVNTNTHMLKTS